MKIDGSLARNVDFAVGENVGFDAANCESRRAYGKSCTNVSFFDVSEDMRMSFCVAGVELGDVPHV